MKIDLVAGARPNLMKIAPLHHALAARSDVRLRFVHTGQHYDHSLSGTFLDELGLPKPALFLDVRSGSHATQTARIMERYEPYCLDGQVDLVVVPGDVNSTLAVALTAKKCGLTVAHIEAGLRSGDRSMPEEINRLATDAISDVFWTPSEDADAHLLREGHAVASITRVGNIMIDAYEMLAPRIAAAGMAARLELGKSAYAVVTLHRPSNVDDPDQLAVLVGQLVACAAHIPLIFPIHPRTRARLEAEGSLAKLKGASILVLEPMGYIDFMSLVVGARLVVTDSGGVQEETSYLGVPCITVRPNTERPVTLSLGTNRLARLEELDSHVAQCLSSTRPPRPSIPLWDGAAAERIVNDIAARFGLICSGRSA